MKTILSTGFLLLVTACAGPQPLRPRIVEAATEPLVCRGEEQCKRYWQRAQVWVATNSRWKIQTATDALIQTYGGSRDSTDRSYMVIKEPSAGGVERILIRSGCGNMFGCNIHEMEAAAQFKLYVRGGD